MTLFGDFQMAWRCSGKTNSELIQNLKESGIIKHHKVFKAMMETDRGFYVPEKHRAYMDSPQYIGFNATISAPHMHAYALEALEPKLKPGAKALDVGSGSGYLCACMLRMMGKGQVVGIDHVSGLVKDSIANVKADLPEALVVDNDSKKEWQGIKLVTGDGRKGFETDAPYDCIHVGAACEGHPQALLDQLADDGGLMFIPMAFDGYQEVVLFEKKNGVVSQKKLMGVQYVPLTDLRSQINEP